MKALKFLFILLMLGGMGFGGWFAYNKYINPSDGTAKEAEKPPPPPIVQVRMAPISVSVIGTDRAEQTVSILVSLETEAPQQAMVKANMPRLSDAFLSTMYIGVNNRQIVRKDGLINISAVKEKLGVAADRVLGPGVVKNILVQSATQHALEPRQ